MTSSAISAEPLLTQEVPERSTATTRKKVDPLALAALSITLILCLLYGPSEWYVKAFVAAACIIGLVWRALLTTPWLWLCLASLLGSSVFVERFTADNHQYLMVYWTLSVALAYFSEDPSRHLRINARLLIGFAFLFAAGWKLVAPDFLNGAFLEFTLLSDARFAGFAAFVSGTSPDVLSSNRDAIRDLAQNVAGAPAVLQGATSIHTISVAMAWFTVAIEGWIALAFLAPKTWWLSRTRDVALNAFVLTTYAVATVPGFSYLLVAMGLMQCDRKPRWIPWIYFLALLSTQLYTMSWTRIASQLSSHLTGGGS